MKRPDSGKDKGPVFAIPLDLPAHGGELTATLHRQLRAAIVEGRLAAGSVLPSTRQAAAALGIARNTVIASYDLLVAEGYVLPRRGARPVVADIAGRRAGARPTGATVQARAGLLAPGWRSLPPRHGPAAPLPARSFRLGLAEHRHFPHEPWRRLVARSWREWAREPFHYPPVEGVPALRAAIAEHIAFARAVACAADDIVVTHGAQHGFDLLARLLVTPGLTRVAVEEPGYPPLRQAFAAAGAQLVPVPVDEQGLRVDALPADVHVICVTPSHQSPTGVAMSLPRRTALLAHARAHDAVVVEDDYDGEFRYGGRPLDALQTLDRDDRVFYVGTFTKSLFPAVDTGFVVVPGWAREAMVALLRLGASHAPAPLQQALAAFIREGHLARHVRRMTPIYAARRDALLHGLRHDLGHWLQPLPSQAGLHLAARIAPAADPRRVTEALQLHVPGAQTVAAYSMQPDAEPMVVFGYGVIDVEAIAPALASAARALSR